jgi:Capsular polysaccharide synthesis protein
VCARGRVFLRSVSRGESVGGVKNENMTDAVTAIPRVLYTYWEGPEEPLVSLCLESMRRQNPGWRLVVAKRASCEAICGRALPAEAAREWRECHVADWFRIQCLAAYGGVWLDASCLCLRPLEAWVDTAEAAALQGFDAPLPRKRGILTNWALACAPGCLFARAWAEEMHACAGLGLAAYRKTFPVGAVFGDGAEKYNNVYFSMHRAASKIRLEHPDYPLRVLPSRDGGRGPHDLRSLVPSIRLVLCGRPPPAEQAFYKIYKRRRSELRKTLASEFGPQTHARLSRRL